MLICLTPWATWKFASQISPASHQVTILHSFEPVKISLANLTVLTVLRFLFFISLKIFWNFQGCITVYLSRCFAVAFNQLWYFITVDFVCQQLFFNFFELFSEVHFGLLVATVIYYNSLFCGCQALFWTFFQSSVAFQMSQRLLILPEPSAFVKHFFFFFRSFCRLSRRQMIL